MANTVRALNCFMLFLTNAAFTNEIEVDNVYNSLSDSHRFYVLVRLDIRKI